MQTVETVEKVTFQKLFLKSGREMLKSTWFWVPTPQSGNILVIFEPVVRDFYEHFSNQGFFDSLVSPLRQRKTKTSIMSW